MGYLDYFFIFFSHNSHQYWNDLKTLKSTSTSMQVQVQYMQMTVEVIDVLN